MNSVRNVQKAIDVEIIRQIDMVEAGEEIHQETRTYDAAKNITIGLRSKEDAHDYRYFPDPDLLPIVIDDETIELIRDALPELPAVKRGRYTTELGLSQYDAHLLTQDRATAEFFEAC